MIPNPWLGRFIVFEGIDYAGKSSQCRRLERWLKAYVPSLDFITTREPTKGHFGKVIREMLGNEELFDLIPESSRQTLFAVDSYEHMNHVVIPSLKESRLVISDRHRLSSIAYGAQSLEDIDVFYKINEKVLGKSFVWPDAIIFIDITVGEAMRRKELSHRETDEAFEKEQKLRKIRSNYHTLVDSGKYPNIYKISGDEDEKKVFASILSVIRDVLNIREA